MSSRKNRDVSALRPPPLVVPPRRLAWVASRITGRAVAHAVVVGASRTVCRLLESTSGATAAPDGTERCAECVRTLSDPPSPSDVSLPNE